MIDITKLTKDDVGKWVTYAGYQKLEQGRIKSWNDKWIFVVYHCDNKWDEFKNYTGCATNPEDLTFIAEGGQG